jgi:hypothetical protein
LKSIESQLPKRIRTGSLRARSIYHNILLNENVLNEMTLEIGEEEKQQVWQQAD